MDLKEVGCDPTDWIALAEDRDQWWAYVRAVVREVPVTQEKQRKGCGMICDVGEAAEVLENELWRR